MTLDTYNEQTATHEQTCAWASAMRAELSRLAGTLTARATRAAHAEQVADALALRVQLGRHLEHVGAAATHQLVHLSSWRRLRGRDAGDDAVALRALARVRLAAQSARGALLELTGGEL